ncbi:protein of unknown function (DUF1083) [Opitutaceae bacterium TAV1]|nr:protein of unknown function (DUF1083) [Opitutaceae bacterium TAV1]
MNHSRSITVALAGILPFPGCASLQSTMPAHSDAPPVVRALRTDTPVTIDGKLDETVWQSAPSWPLLLPDGSANSPAESGSVQLSWDDRYLYGAFTVTDRDVVQTATEDQQHHYQTGDVLELFIKPESRSWYWEFHVTPNGLKTAFFYPSRSYKNLPGPLNYRSGLRVAAQINGTLNNWRDNDQGWTAEIAIPLDELAAQGVPLDAENAWTILVGRYNYGRHLSDRELSSHPALSRANFHRYEEWACLELVPPE